VPAVIKFKRPAKIDGKLWERILILMRDLAAMAGRGRTVAKALKVNERGVPTGVEEAQEPSH
jgi:hypothetical protein